MERLSPKIEIINYFDNLINRIDIDIDSSLEKYNDKQTLSEILKSFEDIRRRPKIISNNLNVEFFDKIDSSKANINSWPESTKVVDYLNQVRMKTIKELRNAQEETIEYYKLNSERFKSELIQEKELKSELFAEKFFFQVNFKQTKNRLWPFNVFTFVTDFYMSQSYIDSLEKLINVEEKPFGQNIVFDDKIVLSGLLFKCFIENLLNFPAHVIHVRKEDVLNIESIKFNHDYSSLNLTSQSTIDLSKLVNLDLINRFCGYRRESVKINIEGLYSLKRLQFEPITNKFDFTIKNLPSLTNLSLTFYENVNEDIVTRLLDQVPHIQELHLNDTLSYFNLDNLVNLRVLSLSGIIKENFNFELFKNLCNQLEDIKLILINIHEKTFSKLFDGYNFPYLVDLTIEFLDMKRLTKEFTNRFPTLRQLNINNSKIEVIEHDSFSNMQQLILLNLRSNKIEVIEENAFCKLVNLEKLNLYGNKLRDLDSKFVGLIESAKYNITDYKF